MTFIIPFYIILNAFHIHLITGGQETYIGTSCSDYFARSIEDPSDKKFSWIPDKEPEGLDCSICNAQDTTESWLVTERTELIDDIKSVHVNVGMNRSACDGCRNQDIKVYVLYKTLPSQPSEIQEAVRILRNMTLVANLHNEKESIFKTHNFHFELKASTFSIVFLSAGTCTVVSYIEILYYACEKFNSDGFSLPRTIAPASGSKRVNVMCGLKKLNKEAYGMCSSAGIWLIISPCMCKKGYPKNIEGEGCLGVPSSVEEINFIDKTETSVTLVWKSANAIPPEQDVLYDITCRKCPSGSDKLACKAPCGSFLTFKPSQNNLRYTNVVIQGLEEDTEYQFVIYSKNENSLRVDRTNWPRRSTSIRTKGSANPSPSGTSNNIGVIIGIVVAVVVVIAILISILACLLSRRKRRDSGHAGPNMELSEIPNIERLYERPAQLATVHSSRRVPPPPTIELPRIPDPEVGDYEEPSQYAQLDSSRRDRIDGNYQSLNAENSSLNTGSNEIENVPDELEYVRAI